MRLFIAREAVDAHLSAAGELIDKNVPPARRARAAAHAGQFYAKWLPTLVTGQGQRPGSYAEFGPLAAHLRYAERASRKLARSTFYAMGRWQGRLERKQGFLGRIVDIGAELFPRSPRTLRGAQSHVSWPTCSAFRPGCAPKSCLASSGTIPTQPTRSWPGMCSPGATSGSKMASSTRRYRGHGSRPPSQAPPKPRICAGMSAEQAKAERYC
jgi:hypothetical protein